jgi:uncharacterized MAPEG superfamily protein
MTMLLKSVVAMAVVTWASLMMASAIRTRGWGEKALIKALGNRETPPTPSALSGRGDRTAANTLENFVLFAALALVAQAAGKANAQVTLGAEIFFWARVAFIPIYLLGIAYVRTIAWAVGVVGLCMMIVGMF